MGKRARGILARMGAGSRSGVNLRHCGPPGPLLFQVLAWVAVCVFSSAVRAQVAQATPATEARPYTLHVYEDLVQVPALVLTSLSGSYHGLTASDFRIRLDSGPAFQPRHVRLQGDDPITLALVLDDSRAFHNELIDGMDAAISGLPVDLFSRRDHVSVYAFDCNLVRATADLPGSIATMQAGVARALLSPALHNDGTSGSRCKKHVQLWDALVATAAGIRDAPGRRVLLVVTEGYDHGSANSWKALRRYADGASIAIFGIRPVLRPINFTQGPMTADGSWRNQEDRFGLLCAGAGGTALDSNRAMLGSQIRRTMDLLRNRYILEFPRPSNGTAGLHDIEVQTTDRTAVIRPSGVTVPVKDKALMSDPSTVPSDPSRAPLLGDRRVLPQ